jgi:hypothetical protein
MSRFKHGPLVRPAFEIWLVEILPATAYREKTRLRLVKTRLDFLFGPQRYPIPEALAMVTKHRKEYVRNGTSRMQPRRFPQ